MSSKNVTEFVEKEGYNDDIKVVSTVKKKVRAPPSRKNNSKNISSAQLGKEENKMEDEDA